MAELQEKPSDINGISGSSGSGSILDYFTSNALVARASSAVSALQERREALGLPNPGTVENISKEVDRDVFLNNYNFSGLRADITKAFSASPLFQVSHQFSVGTQNQSPYTFAALYGSPKMFMQANIDSDFLVSGRFNWRWRDGFVSKTSVQLPPGGQQAMFSLENDFVGTDFTSSIKAVNPSILEGGLTGVFAAEYMQSITPSLALGISSAWQRTAMSQGPETRLSYAARYKGKDWIATALLGSASLQTTYWRKIAERFEAGADFNLQVGQGYNPSAPWQKEGVATVGAKYDFRASSFRAQVDSRGRVAALLEKRVAPPVLVTFVGEIDHAKNQAKLGLAVSIEAMSEDVMEQQERAGELPAPPF